MRITAIVLLTIPALSANAGMFLAGPVGSAFAQERTITFNDSKSLAALGYTARDGTVVRAARGTWVTGRLPDAYREHGMLFLNGVDPPDPALGPTPMPEYHLMYEDPKLSDPLIQARLPDPENQPRYLAPHERGAVIQLTYDPNNDGILDPFTLKRIRVLSGALNIGIKSNRFGVAVYRDLTPTTWNLLEGDNITRATLELPRGFGPGPAAQAEIFYVDDIVFEAFPPTAGGAVANPRVSRSAPVGERLSEATAPFVDPSSLSLFNADNRPSPQVDVIPDQDINQIDLSHRRIEVAIVTTEGFDATSIDPSSVRGGPNGAKAQKSRLDDVNGDSISDLRFLFRISELGLQCADTQLSIEAQTFDGEPIIGDDFVVVVGCTDNVTPE